MLGDDAAALVAGFYEMDQIKSLTKFEAAVLKFAMLSFVHFDLDVVGANNVMEAERARARSEGLRVEAALQESRDEAVRSMHAQRCGRTAHWMAVHLQHVLADLRPFLSACAGGG